MRGKRLGVQRDSKVTSLTFRSIDTCMRRRTRCPCARVILLIRHVGMYTRRVQTQTLREKRSGFTELSIHAYLSPRVSYCIYRSAKEETAELSWYSTHIQRTHHGTHARTHTRRQSRSTCCPIASLVLTERVERRTGIRELSSLLDLASERDTRCSRPSASRFAAPRVCVHGYVHAHTHTHTHTHKHTYMHQESPRFSGFSEIASHSRTKLIYTIQNQYNFNRNLNLKAISHFC